MDAYRRRISGPLLDRIDLHVRARVMAARALQRERYKALPGVRCNAQLPSGALRRYCRMTPAAEKILRSAFERLGYSARAYDRILRVARTVADLDGSEVLDTAHLSETLQYRTLDRKWRAGFYFSRICNSLSALLSQLYFSRRAAVGAVAGVTSSTLPGFAVRSM